MLTPEQVIPFLRHADEMVRSHALYYLRDAHDAAPLTAADVWGAAEHLGLENDGGRVLGLLARVPHDDSTTDKLLAALEKYAPEEDPVVDDVLAVLDVLDIEQLRRHRERIYATAGVDDELRAALDTRLELAGLAHDALWEQLFKEADTFDQAPDDRTPSLRADPIVEALGRHGTTAAERALHVLEEPNPESCFDLFAIRVLAATRHRPALDRLVQLFVETDEEDDGQHEAIMYALPKVGGPDAVAALERAWPGQGPTFQLYASESIGRVKHPDAEAALIRLLDSPMEGYVKDSVSGALAALCTTDGLPALRDLVLDEDYDPTMIDLKQDLIVCAMMAGYDFPEFATLREEVIAREVERERRLEALMNDPNLLEKAEGAADIDELLYGEEYDDLPPQFDDRAPRVVAPIHRDEAKVGRNDPCPCGSGKKYKKCCLGKE